MRIISCLIHHRSSFGLDARQRKQERASDLRINPECSTQEGHDIYDPCAPGSRMGTTRAQWDEAIQKNPELLDLLDGIHFHTLCEQDSDDLETTLVSVKKHFGDLASRVKWINFGGGHHITRPGYDIERLERCIRMVQRGMGSGSLSGTRRGVGVKCRFSADQCTGCSEKRRDTDRNCRCQCSLSYAGCTGNALSTAAYLGTDETEKRGITVRLGGPTCLSGDVIGEYKFRQLPQYGDLLMFGDMAIYTTCKNNTL